MAKEPSGKITLSRPKDKSLEAYKAWITEITSRLNPDAKSTMTEEQWAERWNQFWCKVEGKSSD
jgi:hypothetical protein